MKAPGLGDGLYKGSSNFLWLFKNGKFVPPLEQVTNSEISYYDYYGTDVIYYPNKKKPKYLITGYRDDNVINVKDIYQKPDDDDNDGTYMVYYQPFNTLDEAEAYCDDNSISYDEITEIESIQQHEVTFEIDGFFVNDEEFDTMEAAEEYCDANGMAYSEIELTKEVEPDFSKIVGDKIYYYRFSSGSNGIEGIGNVEMPSGGNGTRPYKYNYEFDIEEGDYVSFPISDYNYWWLGYNYDNSSYESLDTSNPIVQIKDNGDSISVYVSNMFFQKFTKSGDLIDSFCNYSYTGKFTVNGSQPVRYYNDPGVSDSGSLSCGSGALELLANDGQGASARFFLKNNSDGGVFHRGVSLWHPMGWGPTLDQNGGLGNGSPVSNIYVKNENGILMNIDKKTAEFRGNLNFTEMTNDIIGDLGDVDVWYNSSGQPNYIVCPEVDSVINITQEHELTISWAAFPLDIYTSENAFEESIINVPSYIEDYQAKFENIKKTTVLIKSIRFATTEGVVLTDLRDFPSEGDTGLLKAVSDGIVWGEINYFSGQINFNTPVYIGGALSYSVENLTEIYIDGFKLDEEIVENFSLDEPAPIPDFIKDYIYVTPKNNLVVVWTGTDDDTGIDYVKIWKEGTIYELTNVNEYAVVGDYVVAFSFEFSPDNEIATFKIFNCITNEITTIIDNTAETGEEDAIYPEFVLDDDKYIYIIELYGEYGGIVIKKSDMSYKYITPAWQTENSTGDLLGGYQGKIVARNGIITPNAEGGGTFKPFTTPADDDISNQYGGKYFDY